jgi:hypothetical protein
MGKPTPKGYYIPNAVVQAVFGILYVGMIR